MKELNTLQLRTEVRNDISRGSAQLTAEISNLLFDSSFGPIIEITNTCYYPVLDEVLNFWLPKIK